MPLPRVTLDSQSAAALLDLGKHAYWLTDADEINSLGTEIRYRKTTTEYCSIKAIRSETKKNQSLVPSHIFCILQLYILLLIHGRLAWNLSALSFHHLLCMLFLVSIMSFKKLKSDIYSGPSHTVLIKIVLGLIYN